MSAFSMGSQRKEHAEHAQDRPLMRPVDENRKIPKNLKGFGNEDGETFRNSKRREPNGLRMAPGLAESLGAFHVGHHCSYLSLGSERSTKKSPDRTVPEEEIRFLYEEKGQDYCRIISTSKPIPAKGSEEDKSDQPPHREAANYYKEDVLKTDLKDRWLVTMEHPNETSPKPIVIKIDRYKATLEKAFAGGVSAIVSRSAPRAG